MVVTQADPSTRATAFGRGLAQDSAPRADGTVPRALPVGLHERTAEGKRGWLGHVTVVLVAIAMLAFLLRLSQQDVRFGRQVLTALVKGAPWAHEAIDWEHLQTLDVNVGATYAGLPNEQEQRQYRTAFVENFSKGFRQTGVRLKTFANWRVVADEGDRVTVAADHVAQQKTLLLQVSKVGKRQLVGIQWQ